MKNRLLTSVILFSAVMLFPVALSGESRSSRDSLKHEVRIGWGDQMFEHLVWSNPQYIISNMPESYIRKYNERYRYSQHWFAEYQWRVNKWFGLGAMVDASGCVWDEVTRNGLGNEIERLKNRNFWNLTVMPVLRFTWLNCNSVSFYSSLGAGLGVNGGTETDYLGRHTLCGVAVDIALVGMTADWGKWFASAELGGLYSIRGITQVFLCNSRMISVGVGYRF